MAHIVYSSCYPASNCRESVRPWGLDTSAVVESKVESDPIPNRTMQDGLVLDTTLLVIHSFASFLVFLYCHINTEGQVVFPIFCSSSLMLRPFP